MRSHDEFEGAAELGQLREAMYSLPVIEQAKGMFMVLRTWGPDEAFEALVDISQHTNVKLHDVAAVVVAAGSGSGASGLDPRVYDRVLAEVRPFFGGLSEGSA
ncbi:ANTAR domain-containing protein [Amycolatopsis lurida]|uniref:ANTAR domain-containing protein n=1 Tax=Amycolatopsis lurida NRRL 2430 TaxID=1460371 RepID=A0A2P2G1I8_AMYLU|nr:ANTAR domain-containing protein [Amycolatopsis lurida]KFU82832.1 hypothetical protein BB31_03795 [Amycolatopsis lurida NRRL 2430]SEE01498.1 ANTAR domain-containing protein [Amycolatopsis lurida]